MRRHGIPRSVCPLLPVGIVGIAAACVAMALAVVAGAQEPGRATFRVLEKGRPVGTIEMALQRTADGWRLQGTSTIDGAIPVRIPNLDLHYTADWHGRFMTMEMKAPDDAILHVAVVGDTTRTDIVRATEARFRANAVSPDTIFMPDRAFGAYEAVAARLSGSAPVADLPLFVPPIGETRASVDAVETVAVDTTRGPVLARKVSLIEIRDRPTPVAIWIDRGRLLRLDLPRLSLTVVRSDVLPGS
jgi:hypothetical protein